ncbi:MAG: alpha/beta fold hydrolase [Phycisphaerales bacterium]
MKQRPATTFRNAVARLAGKLVIFAYIVALLASHLRDTTRAGPPSLRGENLSKFVEYTDAGGAAQQAQIAAWGFGSWDDQSERRPPLLLLHGCPGSASDFARLAPVLASDGRRVIVVDLPGFGDSERRVRDYSAMSFARAIGGLLDELGITKVYAVGWSNSGGVVLHLAHERPALVTGLVMLAAVGDQRYEGSGSYWVEHLKYRLLGFGGVNIPMLLPHFGAFGDRDWRVAATRFFSDTDQRPLAKIMSGLQTPTLILHGRSDFLIPLRAAEHHHELLANSRLVVLDANHFIPFTHVLDASKAILAFAGDVDSGAPILRTRTDPPPLPPAAGPAKLVIPLRELLVSWGWLAQVGFIGGIALLAPRSALFAAFALVVGLDVDWFVACIALAAARAAVLAARVARGASGVHNGYWSALLRRGAVRAGFDAAAVGGTFAEDLRAGVTCGADRSRVAYFIAGATLSWALRSAVFFLSGWLTTALTLPSHGSRSTWINAALAFAAVVAVSGLAPLLVTRAGRRELRLSFARARRHEYWPTWLYYPPIAVRIMFIALRNRTAIGPAACNPGIPNWGGLIGESKSDIMAAFAASPEVLRTVLVPPGSASDRLERVKNSGIDFPLVLKPDQGQRGHAMKVARDEADVIRYFGQMTGAAVVQPFHPGPHECGVFWVRSVGPRGELLEDGEILSITRKDFPAVVGDGERTVAELIDADPRYERQRRVFLFRFGARAFAVPPKGQSVRLAIAGNHCQGTLFRDGGDLITPRLREAVTRLALSFRGGFDFGRFDLRYESDEALRAGEGFAVIELNGLMSESTNCYDPSRSVFWFYRVLMKQWEYSYAIGAARLRAGSRVPKWLELPVMLRAHYAARTGDEIAD